MNSKFPEDAIPQHWLAAYADNELDAADRRRVEHWLSEHPSARADLDEQRLLSRGNSQYWRAVAPPAPKPEAWEGALSAIAESLLPAQARHRRRPRFAALSVAVSGLAAAILVATLSVDANRELRWRSEVPIADTGGQSVLVAGPDGLALEEGHFYQVARVDDVELIQLPEAAASLVVIGRHPMQDVPLLLAQPDDLQLINFGPDDRGNMPDIATTWGPDVPTFWAPP
jgi:hypothetical protein